jgi:hypothetical protein
LLLVGLATPSLTFDLNEHQARQSFRCAYEISLCIDTRLEVRHRLKNLDGQLWVLGWVAYRYLMISTTALSHAGHSNVHLS